MLTATKVLFLGSVFLAILHLGLPLKCYKCWGEDGCAETPGEMHEDDCGIYGSNACRWMFMLKDEDFGQAGALVLRGCINVTEPGVRDETWCTIVGGFYEDCYCHGDFCNRGMVPCSIRESKIRVPGSCKE